MLQLSGGSLDAYDAAGGNIPTETVAPSESVSTKSSKGKERADPMIGLPTKVSGRSKSKKEKAAAAPSKKQVEKGQVPSPTPPLPPKALRNNKAVAYVPISDELMHKLRKVDKTRMSDDSDDGMDLDDDSDDSDDEPPASTRRRKAPPTRIVSQEDDEPIIISSDGPEIVANPIPNGPSENPNDDIMPIDDINSLSDIVVPIGQGDELDAWALIHPAVYGHNVNENPNYGMKPTGVSRSSASSWDASDARCF